MINLIGVLCLMIIPGMIPVYCIYTFGLGFLEAFLGEVSSSSTVTKRYQVYSLYRFGVKFYDWMNERVK